WAKLLEADHAEIIVKDGALILVPEVNYAGEIVVTLPAGQVEDKSKNPNALAQSAPYAAKDTVAPEITITVDAETGEITVNANEPVF
uniref:hypothetical protein n=1 Tax=Acinetobacter indicus TaxID=756892 RepID=UPI00131589A0